MSLTYKIAFKSKKIDFHALLFPSLLSCLHLVLKCDLHQDTLCRDWNAIG